MKRWRAVVVAESGGSRDEITSEEIFQSKRDALNEAKSVRELLENDGWKVISIEARELTNEEQSPQILPEPSASSVQVRDDNEPVTKVAGKGKKSKRVGMPFSLVAYPPNREWLEKLPDNIALLREFRPDAGKEISRLMRDAEKFSRLALRAINSDILDSHTVADTAAFAAMNAMHCAWLIEVHIGALPLVQAALSAEKEQAKKSKKAADIRIAGKDEVKILVKYILEQKISSRARGHSRSSIAKTIIAEAGKISPLTDTSKKLAKLKERRVLDYITEIKGPPLQKNTERKVESRK